MSKVTVISLDHKLKQIQTAARLAPSPSNRFFSPRFADIRLGRQTATTIVNESRNSQIIGKLHDGPARLQPLVPLRQRTLSAGVGRRRDRGGETFQSLVAPPEEAGEAHPSRAAAVPTGEVSARNRLFPRARTRVHLTRFLNLGYIYIYISAEYTRRRTTTCASRSARTRHTRRDPSLCGRSLKTATSVTVASSSAHIRSALW